MGATGIPGGLRGQTPTAFLIRDLSYTEGTRSRRVLATRTLPGRSYKHVLYAAARFIDTATGEDVVYATVIQYETIRRNGTTEFLFRQESEEVGPCERHCPPAILKLLTPLPPPTPDGTRDPHATERSWRAACYANAGLPDPSTTPPTPSPAALIPPPQPSPTQLSFL